MLFHVLLSLFLFGLSSPASGTEYTEPNEPLFLDIPINRVLNETEGLGLVEPWASRYVAPVDEKRFVDALWARYHIFGEVVDGTVGGTDLTVLGSIEEDAMEYKANVLEDFSHALSIYANTSSNDTHTEIFDLLSVVSHKDTTHLEERATFGISCSADHLAYRNNYLRLIEYMSTSRAYIGRQNRAVFSYGNCYLRVGPISRGPDINYWTAHSVAQLIEGHCTRACCSNQLKTSGWSPANRSHRKVCLSKKASGCS
ncbi:hypothetical protein LCI18_007001 [Fusarium solani-melongenae]|uniref:Uncharacterized protein n=1 Tax=Fusarium solani subsp. cucurbitae TaxID=2747967 RepID=A0ACD3Z5E7_FUSSC|nr:hypothetical protein LCI18_007001 [Fusarium solani-melongenae]